MTSPGVTIAITVTVNPADIANIESLSQHFKRLAYLLHELAAGTPGSDYATGRCIRCGNTGAAPWDVCQQCSDELGTSDAY